MFAKKSVVHETAHQSQNLHDSLKKIHFNSHFMNHEIDLDADKPQHKKPTPLQIAKQKISKKKMMFPFGKVHTPGGSSKPLTEVEAKKNEQVQSLQREHHDQIKKEISDIFKGKKRLTNSQKARLMDPKNA